MVASVFMRTKAAPSQYIFQDGTAKIQRTYGTPGVTFLLAPPDPTRDYTTSLRYDETYVVGTVSTMPSDNLVLPVTEVRYRFGGSPNKDIVVEPVKQQ